MTYLDVTLWKSFPVVRLKIKPKEKSIGPYVGFMPFLCFFFLNLLDIYLEKGLTNTYTKLLTILGSQKEGPSQS